MPLKPSLQKRLARELKDYPYVLDDDEKTIRFQYSKYAVIIREFNQDYPFKPPQVTIDEKLLSYTPSFFPPRLLEEYCKTHKCPCCVSITCPDNWSPSFKITDILKEYLDFVEKLKTFQKLKMFKDVQLPDDMIFEISSYF